MFCVLVINNGLILQWGILANTTQQKISLKFPISFNSTAYSVVTNDWSSPTVSPYVIPSGVYYNNRTKTTIQVNFATNFPRGFGWIGVGK